MQRTDLILSLFPGIDLLGKGFELEGYCVVRGPDIIWGGDIFDFRPPPGKFEGVIGGSPCQQFSKLNRNPDLALGVRLLNEFSRCVTAAAPEWFLLENVPGVPDVSIPGYTMQRLNLKASECGCSQSRLRRFQFGSRDSSRLRIVRNVTEATEAAPLASDGNRANRRAFPDHCELQGLPRDFALPGLGKAAKYRAVGNGVPIPMGRTMARAVRERHLWQGRLCPCDCGRILTGRQVTGSAACRKRLQRERDAAGVSGPGLVTPGQSQFDL
jgi:DNA (cytosine-5)-methyltransferase 1